MPIEQQSPETATPSEPSKPADIPVDEILRRPEVQAKIDEEARQKAKTWRTSDIDRIVQERVAIELQKVQEDAQAQQLLNAPDEELGKTVKQQARLKPAIEKAQKEAFQAGAKAQHDNYLNSYQEYADKIGLGNEAKELLGKRWSNFLEFQESYLNLVSPKVVARDPALVKLLEKQATASQRALSATPDLGRPAGPTPSKSAKDMTPTEFEERVKALKTGKLKLTQL